METKRSSSVIKRLDQYLLKNFPVTWSSRIHTACIYGIGFSILVAILSFIAPNDPRNNSNIHYWIVLVSIISLLAFIFWMIYLLRFNVFKRYGTWKITDTVKTFTFYFIITLIIVSWPFIPPVVESIRANAAYSGHELVQDIDAMNIKICQLEHDSIDTRFHRDTFQLRTWVKGTEMRVDYKTDENDNRVPYYFIDSATLRSKLLSADSVKKLGDSIYIIYDCPDYQFVETYAYGFFDGENNIKNTMTSMDLYRQVLQYKQAVDKEKLRKELGGLFRKYNPLHNPVELATGYYIPDNYYGENSYMSKIRDKYDLPYVNYNLGHIVEKKYRWSDTMIEICLRVAYYITLTLSLLVLIYRHTTRRTFFLSLLTAVVLSILTGLFIAITPYNNSNNAFFTWLVAYFILFILLSAFIFNSRQRNVISGIGLNLLVFMTPFMPLVITGMYYNSLREKYRFTDNTEEHKRLFENEHFHFILSEIGGFLLLILLLATIYEVAYKKWFALPEQ
jgi:hypothetical protein